MLLKTISPEAATGEVADIYTQAQNAWGRVPAPLQGFSNNPFLLKQQWEYYGNVMQHPTLSMPLLACVRMLVSEVGQCHYCIDMNAGMLVEMAGWTPEQVANTRADFMNSPLTDKEKTLLALILKAVKDASSVNAEDIDGARAAGWNDGEIFEAVHHGARMVAGDILINAFKVERDF